MKARESYLDSFLLSGKEDRNREDETLKNANKKILAGEEWRAPWRRVAAPHSERDIKRQAVLQAAARLFLEYGTHRVSMSEIADRLKITKPALYYYFSSKDELLAECFRIGNAETEVALAKIEALGGTGLIKLQNFIREYVLVSTADYGACMVRLDDRDLTEEARAEVRGYKRSINAKVKALVKSGIRDGSIRPCDVKLTVFAIFGALNWIGRWYHSDGANSPLAIGATFAEILTASLIPSSVPRR